MNADRLPKPPNSQRLVPTVSFSVSQAQLDRLRQIAYTRDVSLSRVIREALDVAFRIWEVPDRISSVETANHFGSSRASGESPKGGIRKPTGWSRRVRREIARGGLSSIVDDSILED
jgi:hypothetical protein